MEEEARFSDTHRRSLGAGPRLLLRALESCFHEPRNVRGIMRDVLYKLRGSVDASGHSGPDGPRGSCRSEEGDDDSRWGIMGGVRAGVVCALGYAALRLCDSGTS